MLSFAHMLDLFMNELAGGRRRSLACTKVRPCAAYGLFARH
jgi:hypothetical protein